MNADSSGTAYEEPWDEEDLPSQESSFYGGEDMKAEYEKRVATFDPIEAWEFYQGSLQWISGHNEDNDDDLLIKRDDSKSNVKKEEETTSSKRQADEATPLPSLPYNPHEGDDMAKQLGESLSGFLDRLKPSSTTVESGPWIWIANPSSTPRATYPDIAGFKDAGNDLLHQYMRRKRKLEEANPFKPPAIINRMLRADRLWLEDAIVSLAKDKQVTCGKWMLFLYPKQVDDAWARVAQGTLDGVLGCSAKVATDDGGDRPERLICVYTEDFSDQQDVKRVLREMKRLKLVSDGDGAKSIYYKCEAYTCLDILSGNEYKMKASMYSSRDMFQEMDRD